MSCFVSTDACVTAPRGLPPLEGLGKEMEMETEMGCDRTATQAWWMRRRTRRYSPGCWSWSEKKEDLEARLLFQKEGMGMILRAPLSRDRCT